MDIETQNTIIEQYHKCSQLRKQIVTIFLLSSNREKYIKQAVDSILRQTFSSFCLVILDNNSSDSTKSIIEKYDDDRIFFIQKESPFPGANFQFAFSICNTQYMTVFHDDDVINEQYLSIMLNVINSDDNIVLLSPSANIINEVGEITRKPENIAGRYEGDLYLKHFITKERKMARLWFPANMYRTSFYRKEMFEDFYSAGPCRDQYLTFQSERYGGVIKVISDRLINYRIHSNQDSSINAGRMELQLFNFLMNDEYYSSKIIKYNKLYRYIASAYKAVAINYMYNKDRGVRDCLRIERKIIKKTDIKTSILLIICNISFLFFDITIVPLALLLKRAKA